MPLYPRGKGLIGLRFWVPKSIEPYGYRVWRGNSNGIKKVTGQILVPLRIDDRIEDVVPYLERIAQPGCKVTLLIHYSVEGLDWFQNKSTTPVIKGEKLAGEKEMFPALATLRGRDVTVALDIYAGPLRKVVKQYALTGDIDLIMIGARGGSWMRRLFQICLLFLNFSWVSKSFSVFLLRPDIPKREQ